MLKNSYFVGDTWNNLSVNISTSRTWHICNASYIHSVDEDRIDEVSWCRGDGEGLVFDKPFENAASFSNTEFNEDVQIEDETAKLSIPN